MEKIKNARQESSAQGTVKCPHCGSSNVEYIPEVTPTSFRTWGCNDCLKGFTVCITVQCPKCGSTDISLCYAGKGSFEVWCCNSCKQGFAKGEVRV